MKDRAFERERKEEKMRTISGMKSKGETLETILNSLEKH